MIVLNAVTKVYKSGTEALKNVSISVRKGEFVFVIGPSGCGKSTLVKLLLREELPTCGEVFVNGYDTQSIDRYDLPYFRRRIGVVFQDFRLLPNKTAYENVEFALEVIGMGRRDIRKVVPRLLSIVGLLECRDAYPKELSGGEQGRVALARAIANNPDLLIADEPTGNLDPDISMEIMKLLLKINSMGTTIVVVTHDNNIVDMVRQRVIVLNQGVVVRDVLKGQYRG